MSNYDPQAWQVPVREATWEQSTPSSGFGLSHPILQQLRSSPLTVPAPPASMARPQQPGEGQAFQRQFEDVDRAFDNLLKNGKLYSVPSYRRESMPIVGQAPYYQDFGARMPQRHSVDYDHMRPQSNSNAQGFYSNQRQQPRPNDAEQNAQAKRRMAAQRERDLRNYHQEQQYNRTSNVQGPPEGNLSPNGLGDDERRDLMNRQQRAMYASGTLHRMTETNEYRGQPQSAGPGSALNSQGATPREFGSFSMAQGQSLSSEETVHAKSKEQHQLASKRPSPNPQGGNSHENSTASPASNQASQNFGLFDGATQQSSRTSTSSPGGSPPRQGKVGGQGVAPIGTRPAPPANAAFSKGRNGTPSQSPLSHGYTANNDNLSVRGSNKERAPSAASNPTPGGQKEHSSGAWGSGSGVWNNSGNNKNMGAVWG